jgi:hypothetical protein
MLATGNEDGSIRLWSCDTGSAIVLKGHTNTVTCLDVAERRKTTMLISAGYDGCVGVWDVTKRHNVLKPRLEATCLRRCRRRRLLEELLEEEAEAAAQSCSACAISRRGASSSARTPLRRAATTAWCASGT